MIIMFSIFEHDDISVSPTNPILELAAIPLAFAARKSKIEREKRIEEERNKQDGILGRLMYDLHGYDWNE